MIRLIFLTLVIFSLKISAFVDHTAIYNLSIGGVLLAKEKRTLSSNNNIIRYSSEAKPTQLGKLIGDKVLISESIAEFNNGKYSPLFFKSLEISNKEIKKELSIYISYRADEVSVKLIENNKKPKTFSSQNAIIIDPLSSFISIANLLKNKDFIDSKKIYFANGKNIKQIDINIEPSKIINFQEKDITSIKVIFSNSDYIIESFFAPDFHYLPIKIIRKDNKKDITYELDTINFQ